ncbi:hypothetical protein [Neobacillus citreus]|uniref:Uncharacterized protein n=1 Tax=Neobacillus citreus TaxID=2833578 RepID=A0A942SW78_9BACI|nr:hypothetical protein [Neobacillus citreus]MCH6268336.1 hypothetical protein [Neobacillus citreus]
MVLTYRDLAEIFSEKQGVQGDFAFYTVTDMAGDIQPKGLFISISEDSGSLSEAIAQGAIAVLWDKRNKLPNYTPNHFPVFFTDDSGDAIVQILTRYIEKLDGEATAKMETTNFKFSNKKLLNKNNESYDIAVMLKKIIEKQEKIHGGRG